MENKFWIWTYTRERERDLVGGTRLRSLFVCLDKIDQRKWKGFLAMRLIKIRENEGL
ncbi:hypothetical protein Hanom_Chr07g00634831 [Helianthus anomalus]